MQGFSSSRNLIILLVVGAVIIFAVGLGLSGAFAGRAPQIGEPAPTFRVTTIDGQVIDSSAMAGKVLVVNFFATWCQPCRQEAGDLEALWGEYKDKGVLFVAIAYNDVDAKVREFVQQAGISFPVANSSTDIGRQFGVTGVPETYVIGPDGILRYRRIGVIDPPALRQVLNMLIP
ncbi:MAG: TlpA family protein disulfide reductase [Anaerolineae bacterium]